MTRSQRLKTSITLLLLLCFPASLLAFEVHYYETDALGTPITMVDVDGNRVWKAVFYPFGEERAIQETPESNDRRFLNKEKDKETGLTYFEARYMEANTGRFLSPDPVGPVDEFTGETNYVLLTQPQRLNRYAYGLNNPYRYVDPDGRIALELAMGGAEIGFSFGGPWGGVAGGVVGLGLGLWGGQQVWDHIFAEESNNTKPDGTSVDAGSSKNVTNSAGKQVERKLVKNQDELLEAAEKAAGGSLDDYNNYKPDWYESSDGLRRIEWNTKGHSVTNEGPHVTVRDFDGRRHNVTEKTFIEGQEEHK